MQRGAFDSEEQEVVIGLQMHAMMHSVNGISSNFHLLHLSSPEAAELQTFVSMHCHNQCHFDCAMSFACKY